jgi:ATP-binding cassette, subfamily B, putative efflux pump
MSIFKTYFAFVKPYWKLVIITLLIGMIKFGIPLTLPLLLKYVIDDIMLSTLTADLKIEKLIYVMLGAFALFIVIRAPMEYLRQYFAQLITSRILFDLRNRLYVHIQKLSLRYYQNNKTGEIISRILSVKKLYKRLIVAHRLSTITHADQIVLIENGEIIEKGSHEELMRREGGYARLFNVQNLKEVELIS